MNSALLKSFTSFALFNLCYRGEYCLDVFGRSLTIVAPLNRFKVGSYLVVCKSSFFLFKVGILIFLLNYSKVGKGFCPSALYISSIFTTLSCTCPRFENLEVFKSKFTSLKDF